MAKTVGSDEWGLARIYSSQSRNKPITTYEEFQIFIILLCICVSMVADAQRRVFSPAEQQQISIPTPNLFARSNAFEIDFSSLKDRDYSFPLPVGKAVLAGSQAIEIETKREMP